MFIRDRVSTQESGNAASGINHLGLRSNRFCVEANQTDNQSINQSINQWLDLAMDERSSKYEEGLE